MSRSPAVAATAAEAHLSYFDCFPYLVTRIVPAMYHIMLLSEGLIPQEDERILFRQVMANRLPTTLVLAADRALYVTPYGRATWTDQIPRGGFIVADRLRPCARFAETSDLARRRERLAAVLSAQPREGFMFGDLTKGGRKATLEETVLLAGHQLGDVPRGLSYCPGCQDWRGQCLDPSTQFAGLLMTVHCRCDNDNRCAACGQRLYERKLNANYYDTHDGQIWHVPGFSAFSHACRSSRPSLNSTNVRP